MKKIALIGSLVLFTYAGFQPPDGMRKFPTANLQFQVKTPQGNLTATVGPSQKESTDDTQDEGASEGEE